MDSFSLKVFQFFLFLNFFEFLILDGHRCIDLDECLTHPCQTGFNCENTLGSFICHDVNECREVSSIQTVLTLKYN